MKKIVILVMLFISLFGSEVGKKVFYGGIAWDSKSSKDTQDNLNLSIPLGGNVGFAWYKDFYKNAPMIDFGMSFMNSDGNKGFIVPSGPLRGRNAEAKTDWHESYGLLACGYQFGNGTLFIVPKVGIAYYKAKETLKREVPGLGTFPKMTANTDGFTADIGLNAEVHSGRYLFRFSYDHFLTKRKLDDNMNPMAIVVGAVF